MKTLPDIEELRKLYTDAIKNDKETFWYKGQQIDTLFAEYMIRYHKSEKEKENILKAVE